MLHTQRRQCVDSKVVRNWSRERERQPGKISLAPFEFKPCLKTGCSWLEFKLSKSSKGSSTNKVWLRTFCREGRRKKMGGGLLKYIQKKAAFECSCGLLGWTWPTKEELEEQKQNRPSRQGSCLHGDPPPHTIHTPWPGLARRYLPVPMTGISCLQFLPTFLYITNLHRVGGINF